MFHTWLADGRRSSQQAIVVNSDRTVTWSQAADAAKDCVQQLESVGGGRVGLSMHGSAACLAVLSALDELRTDVFLLDVDLESTIQRKWAAELQLDAVVSANDNELSDGVVVETDIQFIRSPVRSSTTSSVTILTSGTSGKPKASRHTWLSLSRPVRKSTSEQVQIWLLTFRPHLYAGLQVLLQCVLNQGTLVVPDRHASPDQVVELMQRADVQHASATPSYWRHLMMFADERPFRRIRLSQITLGGEIADDAVLQNLAYFFPEARIAHIYATTELGRCFSVTDGRAGFPADYLDGTSTDGVQLRIEDGELVVRSKNAMLGYDLSVSGKRDGTGGESTANEWFYTGDLVERCEDRIMFVGRRTDMINVGGNKVRPMQVEDVIRGVDGIRDVRVFGQDSSIAGQLVACDIVPAANTDANVLRQQVFSHCAEQLRPFQRPRFLNVVTEIQMNSAGKRLRSE